MNERNEWALSHLDFLESQPIHILRETAAQFRKLVLLYSMGKDSTVLLHLARKAFWPPRLPIPLLHVDTTWEFREMYAFRQKVAAQGDVDLLIHVNEEGLARGINPIDYTPSVYTNVMKTEALRQALDKHGFDAAIGGARRDEEVSRAKDRIFSFRSKEHRWDPRKQRPEVWTVLKGRLSAGQSVRVFPLSNWTERDVVQETAISKAKAASEWSGSRLGLRSEGSFSPHPGLLIVPVDREVIALYDRDVEVAIVEWLATLKTNYAHVDITTLDDAIAILQIIKFPSHGVVVSGLARD